MTINTANYASALRGSFSGDVIASGGEGWDVARQAFNLTVDQQPLLIARAQNAEDVVTAVRFAAEHGLRVAPQGSAHNAGPLGHMAGTILLKTSEMKAFEIDATARKARVEAGAKWGPLVDVLSADGLAALSGSARDVGAVAYSLGGGLGWLGRKYGLQANAVTLIEVVTADGRQLRVDHENEPELFWALRGAGANFGIVTAIEFDLVALDNIYGGSLFFPFERASEVVHAWREWARTLPEEVSTTLKLLQLPPLPTIPEPLRGNSFAVIQAVVLGNEALSDEVFAPLRALGPQIDNVAKLEPADLSRVAMDPEEPFPVIGDGRLFGDIPAEGFDRLLETAGPGSGSPLLVAEMRLLGGALGRSQPGYGAIDRLDGAYSSYLAGAVPEPSIRDAVVERVDLVYSAMAPYESRRYANFSELPTDVELFFGAERTARLRELRAQWDPQRILHPNHEL